MTQDIRILRHFNGLQPLQAPYVFPCQGSYLLSGLNRISSAIGSFPIASKSDHHTIDDQCCHMHRKVFIHCAATISATPTYFVHAHSSAWLTGPSKRRWCSLYWTSLATTKCIEHLEHQIAIHRAHSIQFYIDACELPLRCFTRTLHG